MKKTGVQMTADRMAATLKAIGGLVARDVLVGNPAAKAPREGDPINNPTIGYISEYGSPARNIPARPWLAPGIQKAQGAIADEFGHAAQAALDGSTAGVTTAMKRAGLVAVNSARTEINTGDFVPLADSTLRARARRGRGDKGAKLELASRDAGNAPSNDFARPLIDTGQFRNSVAYVVR